ETCTRPESLETQALASLIARMALRRSVEVRSRACGPAASTISLAKGASAGLPNTQIEKPSAVRALASSAKYADGQRLLGPTAPGAKAITGRPSPARPRVARHLSASAAGTL